MKQIIRRAAVVGAVLLFGSSACADLDVTNPNAADSGRALASAGDVESLVAGSFRNWWFGSEHEDSGGPILGNSTFMFSSWPANFGMVFYSQKPRVGIVNLATHEFYEQMVGYTWRQNYRSLSAVAQGLAALDDPEIAAALGPDRVRRLRAYGKFVQGMSHGSLAMLYTHAWILDERSMPVTDPGGSPLPQELHPYSVVMEAALGYFDDAIALAGSGNFNADIPSGWMSRTVSREELVDLAHSMKARYRANVARTPEERAAVDWDAVVSDVDAGVSEDWKVQIQHLTGPFWSRMKGQFSDPVTSWGQLSYQMHGMADQSGMYQDWLGIPPGERLPDFPDGSPRLIVTPDTRFPQGTTEAEQREAAGTHIAVGPKSWGQPGRGTFRWSYYRNTTTDFSRAQGSTPHAVPEVTMHEMRLLKAEGLYRNGDLAGAADLVNVTRTAAGLNATDETGTNSSCVPKLPDGSCGDLFEMLKWEKRMETAFFGVHSVSWFFDGRGWGDLYLGTPLERPVPCGELELGASCASTGGLGGPSAAPLSAYNFPHEG